MDNGTKLSKEQINSIMKEASEGRVSPEEIMGKHLDEGTADKLKSILNDPQKLKSIMESPMAKKLFAAMSGKKEEE